VPRAERDVLVDVRGQFAAFSLGDDGIVRHLLEPTLGRAKRLCYRLSIFAGHIDS
jgi:hypothetical protein